MRLLRWAFYFLLVSLPLGTRTLIFNFEFLYLSDVLLVLFLVIFLKFNSNILKNLRINSLVVFLILAGLSVFFSSVTGLAAYNFSRLALLVATSIVIGKLLKIGIVKIEGIFWTLGGLAVLQSLIGILQFIKQSDLGLQRLGEATLGGAIPGVAKIVVEGAKIVRAYGTFPHPNILAAFLLVGYFALLFLWFRYSNRRVLIAGGIFIILLGLTLAFSRIAWLIAALLTVILILRTKNWRLAVFLTLSVGALFLMFRPYILYRASVATDEPAVVLRGDYNRIGWEIIKNNWLGVGIGNQVAFTRESGVYQKFGLFEAWQFQPIHNIYLLIASEIGVLGLLAFLAFLIKLFAEQSRSATFNVIVMLSSLLLFGFTDHFLWTSQSGQLMLWLTIGLLMGFNSAEKRS